MKDRLTARLQAREARIGIVGLGYVGLPLVLRYAQEGYRVLGFDIDDAKIARIARRESYIEHISADAIGAAIDAGFEATSDFGRAGEVDALILCVPTPLTKHREPDLTYVVGTMESLVPHLRDGQVVSLESTTYPGTTDEELAPRIAKAGFAIGETIFLVYSPEREDPANPQFNTQSIPKVVGGQTPACLEVGLALYGNVIDRLVPVSSTRAAELTKLLENIHRAVNIGLVNEMKIVADRMDVDIHEVIAAAATKPFGFVAYRPGPGLGGHCIPIDPFYLTWKAREYGVSTRFIELAGEVNSAMPAFVIEKVAMALNARHKSVNGAKVLVLGIAYKPNVDDMRESPSLVLLDRLRALGAEIAYSDPHIPVIPKTREHSFDLASAPLTPETLASYDCVILATDHARFDYDLIRAYAQLIVDTRGKFARGEDKVVAA